MRFKLSLKSHLIIEFQALVVRWAVSKKKLPKKIMTCFVINVITDIKLLSGLMNSIVVARNVIILILMFN